MRATKVDLAKRNIVAPGFLKKERDGKRDEEKCKKDKVKSVKETK